MAFYLLSFLLHAYMGVRLLPALAPLPVTQAVLLAVLAASAVLMPLSLLGRRILGRGLLSKLFTWLGLVCMGLFSSLLVLTLVRDASLLLAWVVEALWPGATALPALQLYSAVAVPVLGLLATLWGFVNARRTAAVVRVDVPIQGLPAALHGFTVAQISDIHVGPTIRRGYLRRIVRAVNGLQADMVAITGDLVDGKVHELAPHVAPLAGLSSRHGTYFVTGNHEYYSGADAWIIELRRLGVHVLLNQHVVLQHGDARGSAPLVVAGVADFGAHHFDPTHRSDPARALAGAPADARVRMLLAHQPRSAPAAARAGFQLQLSGHTHGGQFFPWNFFVRLQQPFTAGLHRLQDLWVYTSRGTGYWGPPKRFGAPSEITHLRLVPA
ncbi:MAG TPA: metallophosphoesterase [Burkholderiaceae bacterium]|nr:metallophosphoesterase [Burkholderiaceae bacterium]